MNKYPKRGEDCIHTWDCIWGIDGWCDRPDEIKCVLDRAKSDDLGDEEDSV